MEPGPNFDISADMKLKKAPHHVSLDSCELVMGVREENNFAEFCMLKDVEIFHWCGDTTHTYHHLI